MAPMPDNVVSAAQNSRLRGNVLSAMDRLPAPIRRALHEAVNDWDPREIRWFFNKRIKAGWPEAIAVAAEIASIAHADATEIARFAHRWPARFGEYPHLAADATILRYDEGRPNA